MDIKLIIYYLCIAVGGIISAVVDFYIGKKNGFSKDTLKTYIIFGITAGVLSAYLMGQLQNFIMSLTEISFYPSRLRIFGALLFLPLFFLIVTKLIGGDFGKITDIFTSGTFIMLGISKIGCAVYGCCYGIPFTYGVTTPFEDHRVFPVQLLESAFCLLIAAFSYLLQNKKNHRKGTVYPTALILYGVMRFFAEYLRYYSPAEKTLFFGLSFWQMFSVISIIIGAVWIVIGRRQS